MKKIQFMIALPVFALLGCRHHHTEEGHHHDLVKRQYSVYTPEMEMFAEADPFVAGESTRVLVHLTSLPEFQPVESRSVTLIISSEKEEVRQSVEKGLKQGIYEFHLKPGFPGTALMKVVVQSGDRNLMTEVPGEIGRASCRERV